jgi:hypothetical protein
MLLDQDNFDSIFKAKTIEPFRHEIRQIFNRSLLEASPLRIIRKLINLLNVCDFRMFKKNYLTFKIAPRIVSQRDSFTIYSGVVSSGPPIRILDFSFTK